MNRRFRNLMSIKRTASPLSGIRFHHKEFKVTGVFKSSIQADVKDTHRVQWARVTLGFLVNPFIM